MESRIFIDAAYKSLNKYTEELCGDRCQIVRTGDYCTLVLSDGLGSGVKANILSTLTSKIISTMVAGGATIEDTVETIVHTLPVCSVRNVAYSTFSILKIDYKNKKAYLSEFDCPNVIFVRNGKLRPIIYETREIAGKTIKESVIDLEIGDYFILMSDGVIYAGIGALLNLGWDWDNVAEFVEERAKNNPTAARMTNLLSDTCNDLYMNKPGDDTTILTAKVIPQKIVSLFSGPPQNKEDDERIITDFLMPEGKKIVCGGSSANMAARIMGEEVITKLDYLDPEVPPIAEIPGIDLVTEGVLTLKRVIEILKRYYENPSDKSNLDLIDDENGASQICKILVEDCTHLKLFIGKSINPAHQNPFLPVDLSIKLRLLEDLFEIMEKAGKVVTRKFY